MNIKEINISLDTITEYPKEKCIERACQLLEIFGYYAMTREIKEGKQTVKRTCEYLINCKGTEFKRKEILKVLLRISTDSNI